MAALRRMTEAGRPALCKIHTHMNLRKRDFGRTQRLGSEEWEGSLCPRHQR